FILFLPLLVLLVRAFGTDLVPFLFCEMAAAETPLFPMTDGKPKEGVKAKNNDHINLKVAGQDSSVAHRLRLSIRHLISVPTDQEDIRS
ncbi:hypothetical protein E2I00_009430, partial [Balaenoptera physalus]